MRKMFQKGLLFAAAAAVFCMGGENAQAAKAIAPKKLVLSEEKVMLYTGAEKKLEVRAVKPENASQKVIWKSKNPKIVSVSKRGKLTAKRAGTTQVTATSAKNRKAMAKVKVAVRKHPKRVEKDCAFTGEIVQENRSLLYEWGGSKVIRSKAELESAVTACKWAKRKRQGYADDIKRYLKKYEGTDFRKKSLVFVETEVFLTSVDRIVSVKTQRDPDGKLCGKVTLWCEEEELPPGTGVLCVMEPVFVILEMDKKDVAMTDYFECEKLFADEEESHAFLAGLEQTDRGIKVRVAFQNKGTEIMTCSRNFWAEKADGHEWVKMPVQNSIDTGNTAFQVLPGQTVVETFTLCSDTEDAPYQREDFGEYGTYRIHVDGSFAKEKYHYVQFNITPPELTMELQRGK